MKQTLILLAIASILLTSCKDSKHYFIEMSPLKKDAWTYKDTLHFRPVIKEKGAYRIVAVARHTKEYEFSNVWLKIGRDGKESRVDIPLFDLKGNPTGECSGRLCTQARIVNDSIVLQADTLDIFLIQNMRRNPLTGITDAGIIIDKLN
jgi:gliding motility-associated lipoprotein GldH